MKKYLLITALILSTMVQPAMATGSLSSSEELEELFNDGFYETPFGAQMPDVTVVEGSTMKPVRGMPLFKKTRIKVTNKLRERKYKKTLELIEKEKQEQAKEESEENAKLNRELNINFSDPTKTSDVESQTDTKSSKKANKKKVSKEQKSDDTLELEGGVKQQVTQNDVTLDADNIDYDDKTFDITATGHPVLVFPPQNVTIKADKMIYNKASNNLKAYGTVEVIRDGKSVFGDFLQINMNEEDAFLDNMRTKESVVEMTSKNAEMTDDKITLYNGRIESKDSYILDLHTRMIGGNYFNSLILDEDDRSEIFDGTGDTAINIKAKEVDINAKKYNDVISLKKAQFYAGDAHLFNYPVLTIHTNKKHEFFDANYPELGSRGRLGMFAGPGFVFDTPLQDGSTLKLLPIINSKSGLGFGGMAKYRSATNYTDLGYGSAANVFILRGKQFLDDKLYLQYGANSYMNEWWFGPRMPKYGVELIYHDRGVIPSTIGKGLDLNFKHRASFGYMQNNDYNRHGEHFDVSDIGTTRTRYMAEIAQSLYNYKDVENRMALNLSMVMQGSAALYGTGDTQFVGRVGPFVHSQVKNWMQDIGFFMAAYQDNSPLQMYDAFRYGHSMFVIRESLRLCKYVTVAWSGVIRTDARNNPANNDMFQENSFILAFGPDDVKLSIGYDWVRQQTYFSFVLAMDTKGSSLDYEKMVIKNPDRLAKSNREEPELKVYEVENNTSDNNPVVKKMMYAEVIDIEDPNREQL